MKSSGTPKKGSTRSGDERGRKAVLCPQSEALLQNLKALSLRKDVWVEDSVVKQCFLCSEKFSVTRRRHHCRICGNIFCKKCSSGVIDLYSSTIRTCTTCIQYLQVTPEAEVIQFLKSKLSAPPKIEGATGRRDSDSEDSDSLDPSDNTEPAGSSTNAGAGAGGGGSQVASIDTLTKPVQSKGVEMNALLHVTIVEGKNLAITKESSGVYCLLSLGRQQVRTTNAKGASPMNRHAKWNEAFYFDVTNSSSALVVSMWAEYLASTEGSTSFLGEMAVPVCNLLEAAQSRPIEKEFKLYSKSSQEASRLSTVTCRITATFNKNKITPDDFQYLKVLGRGNFGKVVQVKKRDTERIYAMKILNKHTVVQNDAIQHTLAERNVLRRINHPFIVGLRYSFQTPEKLYLVLDYLCGGELFTHLSSVDHFSEWRTKFYAASIVLALGYLHSMDIIYRDLKPENLLLDMDGFVCLTDFGLVKENIAWDEKTNTYCGSPEYLAPEILLGKPYGKSVDWWALGTFIYEMLSGWPPFFDENHKMMNRRILYEPLSFEPKLFSENAKSLIRGLLERTPEKRLGSGPTGTEDIMKHPFFSDVDWTKLMNREIEPPFKPHLKHLLDTRFFSEEFTNESVKESYVDAHLSRTLQDAFKNFSWQAESEMVHNMAQNRRSRRLPPQRDGTTPTSPRGIIPEREKSVVSPSSLSLSPIDSETEAWSPLGGPSPLNCATPTTPTAISSPLHQGLQRSPVGNLSTNSPPTDNGF